MANPGFPSQNAQKVASVWNNSYALVDEGGFYVATNPTTGTGIATTTSVVDDAATASATHAQNVPVMYIANRATPSDPNAKTIYLQYLKMYVTAAPTSATFWNYSIRADNVPRYTSGGSVIQPVNTNTNAPNQSIAQIVFGAVVTANLPSSNARLLSAGAIQSSIPVVKDLWFMTFGDVVQPSSILTASAAKNINIPCGPIAIAPGWNIAIGMWGASNTGAPAWEFELGYVERVAGQ